MEANHVRVAFGHDKQASDQEILNGLKVSKQSVHFTHVFNVQNFNHRTPGLANYALVSAFPSNMIGEFFSIFKNCFKIELPEYEGIVEPTIELIGDRAHLHDLTVAVKKNSFQKKKQTKIDLEMFL